MIGEVLRIKEIVANQDDEPDSLLFESLRRLQLMGISVETLKLMGAWFNREEVDKFDEKVRLFLAGTKIMLLLKLICPI
ncbi:hypothetical protein Taro_037438 [Colocasia esculenta]|uniref:Uncharacterized protein n=1 Tax=Colocasia esculenta TaxID=4460 RepID=A0A843WCU7_COLES|nr:hypothetical protein [Colocasia esculenta]